VLRIRIIRFRIYYLDADLDPNLTLIGTDPDPTFNFDADPDPAIFYADPDLHQRTRNTEYGPSSLASIATLYGSRISLHSFQHPAFHFDADPDPDFPFDMDPDPQNVEIGSIMYGSGRL
jgi:hypothetical protein